MRHNFLLVCLLSLLPSLLCAAEKETRVFSVRVSDKEAGSYTMVITKRDDGTVLFQGTAEIHVKILIKTYDYAFRGAEVWKDGRLVRLESNTIDDGKKHSVSASAVKDGLTVKTSEKETSIRGEVHTASWWHLPGEKIRDQAFNLLDADTGIAVSVRLEKVGLSKINIGGREIPCMQYKLTGGAKGDLWFDGSDRLLRHDFIEQGQKTTLELTRLSRE